MLLHALLPHINIISAIPKVTIKTLARSQTIHKHNKPNKQTHTRDTHSFPRCPTWLACVTFPVCQSPLEPHECRETWHSTAWAGFLVDSTCSEDVIGSISDKRNGRFFGRWVESRVNISLYWIFTPYIFPFFKFCRCMHFFLLPTFWIISSHFFFF